MLKVGDSAPNFTSVDKDLKKVELSHFSKPIKVIVSVPSVDTGICDTQVKKFHQELSGFDNVEIITLSVDLPFAQSRWCGANNIKNLTMLSDYQNHDFAKKYDAWLDDLKLLKRAVFVIGADNKVKYVEYCPTQKHPNYDQAFSAIKALL